MARINIEQTWWSDPRRERLGILLGNPNEIETVVIKLWLLSQNHWQKGELIPGNKFIYLYGAQALYEAGLVRVYDTPRIWVYPDPSDQYPNVPLKPTNEAQRHPNEGQRPPNDTPTKLGSVRDITLLEPYWIYANGTREQHFWLVRGYLQRVAAGKKSAEKRKITLGTAQPKLTHHNKPQNNPENPERNNLSLVSRSNEPRTDVNGPEPSSSSSSSFSFSSNPLGSKNIGLIPDKKNQQSGESAGVSNDTPDLNFEELYLKYPKRLGNQKKKEGLRYCRNNFRTVARFKELEKAILKYADSCRRDGKNGTEFVCQFKTFVSGVWEEWSSPQQDEESLARRRATEKALAETKRKLEAEAYEDTQNPIGDPSVDAETAHKAIAKIMNMNGFMKEMPKPKYQEEK